MQNVQILRKITACK